MQVLLEDDFDYITNSSLDTYYFSNSKVKESEHAFEIDM